MAVTWIGNVWYSEKRKSVRTADGRDLTVLGSLIIKGDIAPDLVKPADGKVEIRGGLYDVWRVDRPRNPDGTVHHTTVEQCDGCIF